MLSLQKRVTVGWAINTSWPGWRASGGRGDTDTEGKGRDEDWVKGRLHRESPEEVCKGRQVHL